MNKTSSKISFSRDNKNNARGWDKYVFDAELLFLSNEKTLSRKDKRKSQFFKKVAKHTEYFSFLMQKWKILDLGVKKDSDPNDTDLMFHRVGLRVGAEISEGNYERALLFCGMGMGIHIAASKCPHVHTGVVESLPAATRAITGNGVNVLAMGAFYVAPQTACDIADAYLSNELGSGWE